MRIVQPQGLRETQPLTWVGSRGEVLRLSILDEHIVRVQHRPCGSWRLDRSWMVGKEIPREGRHRDDESEFPRPAFHSDEELVRTSCLQVRIQLEPFSLTWHDASGAAFANDLPNRAYSYCLESGKVFHYMEHREDELYYGLGERSGPLDKSGRRYRMHNVDALGYDAEYGDPLYKHFPVYITFVPERQLAYALIYDNLASCTFDLGLERDAYHGRYRHYVAEDGDLDYYMILGPTLAEVVSHISEWTGRTPMPPNWALGYLGSTMSYTDAPDAQVQLGKFVELCREHRVPCDMFHLSSGFTLDEDGKRNVFTWNRSRVPDPAAMVEVFHQAGQRVAANIKPCLLTTHPRYGELARRGLFIKQAESDEPEVSVFWGGQGSYLDFTNPETYAWWREQVREQILGFGIDSTWNDNNEYEVWDDKARCQGFPIGLGRPIQTLLMMRASYEEQLSHAPHLRPFLISRSGPLGMQRYVQTWSGDNATDWKSLAYNIPMGLGLSLSGQPSCGHDVGGFYGPAPSPELLVRWVQNGVFHPRFVIHSWNTDGTVNEPWMYPDVLDIVRHWIEFRYRLFPYFYTLFERAAASGEPIIRPPVYHYPHDRRTHRQSFDFMLGPSLLVASVLEEGATLRRVYLPSGTRWFDFFEGTVYEGGQEIELQAELDQVPLLANEGAIVPLDDELYVFPGSEGEWEFSLRYDDGVSLDGPVTHVYVRLRACPNSLTVQLERAGEYPAPGRLEVICRRVRLAPGRARVLRSGGRDGGGLRWRCRRRWLLRPPVAQGPGGLPDLLELFGAFALEILELHGHPLISAQPLAMAGQEVPV